MNALMIGALAGVLCLAACGEGPGSPVAASGTTAAAATALPSTTATTVVSYTTTAPPSTQPVLTPASGAPTTQLAPPTTAVPALTIVNVVDGDTVDLSTGERVRIIGIDTPERGACGFEEASDALVAMLGGQAVVVTPGARDDVDKYGRILLYIDAAGVDVGLSLIQQGLATARYDSRDGYGHHSREELYVAADAASPSICAPPTQASSKAADTTAPAPAASAYYANCAAARAAGVAPLHEGEPGYRSGLDRDHDGVACE
jgi:micrococcal nuclease